LDNHSDSVLGDAADTHIRGSFDPTGTGSLRAKFRADTDRRWSKLRQLVTEAIATHDIVGLGKHTVGSISAAASVTSPTPRLPHGDRVKGFQVWLDEALRQIVLGNDGAWTTPYVRKAAQMGQARVSAHTGKSDIPKPNVLAHMQSSVSSELRGICAAVSQQATRVVAQGILSRKRPALVARQVAGVVRAVGVRRGHALVSFSVVKAFNDSLLDGLRSAGVTRVGVVPEKLRIVRGPHGLTKARDAEAPCVHLSLLRDAKRKKMRSVDLSLVNILTAGDDRVCFICEDASDLGPYSIDDAEGMIPFHPSCRCVWSPAFDDRFASVHDAFDPDEPRNERGEWTSGIGLKQLGDIASRMSRAGFIEKYGNPASWETHDVLKLSQMDPSELDEWGDWEKEFSSHMKAKVEANRVLFNEGKTPPPLLVRGTPNDDNGLRPQVIDGHHRYVAAMLEGKKVLPVKYDKETLGEIWDRQS
jgi:hypothetical protein